MAVLLWASISTAWLVGVMQPSCSSDWRVWFSGGVFTPFSLDEWLSQSLIRASNFRYIMATVTTENHSSFASSTTLLQLRFSCCDYLPTTCAYLQQLANMGKRMAYDSSFKLKAIEKAKELGSNRKAADFFGVTEKMVRDWRKKEDHLKTVKKTDKRLKGCGRSVRDRGFDDRIMQWLSDARSEGHAVTGSTLQLQARRVSSDPGFRASAGWLEKFKMNGTFSPPDGAPRLVRRCRRTLKRRSSNSTVSSSTSSRGTSISHETSTTWTRRRCALIWSGLPR